MMVADVVSFHVMMLFIGIIMGIIERWKPKVLFAFIICLTILSVAEIAFFGQTVDMQANHGWSNWYWITMILAVFVGMHIGNTSYDKVMSW